MKALSVVGVVGGILAGLGGIAWAAQPNAAGGAARHPVVVELFQSQGCSDCPPAEANLNAIAGRPDVLALSYGVTYWDYLGWKDSFATPQFTARQWAYAHHNDRSQVATPQVWINGRTTLVGSNGAQLNAAIAAAGSPEGPALAVAGGRLSVGRGTAPAGGADLWLVRYDPRTIDVAIHAGENGGRTLPHRDIVRQLIRIGHWAGAPITVGLPKPAESPLRSAVLVQGASGGPIVAAARI